MGTKILKFIPLFFLLFAIDNYSNAQVAPYALSPRWVFGNKGEFDFTSGSLVQVARTDNIIANEGSSTLCLRNKSLLAYDNNVRVAGNNHTPLGSFMIGSSSSTQGGLILPDPSSAAATSFFWITANAESTYPTQEPNDAAGQGWRIYSGSQSGASVTAPSLVSTLTTNTSSFPWESLYSSVDGNYGYYILSAGGNPSAIGQIYINKWNLSSAGVVGGLTTLTYSAPWYSIQAQASVKINKCQNKIAIVNGPKLGVFNWDRTTGTIGTVIKDMSITISGGGKLYGVEFSPNGNYVFITTLNGDKLSVVDLTSGGTSGGETLINGTWSGSLQLGPNNIIYVANGFDATPVTTIGTITNPDSGPSASFNVAGLSLTGGSSVRLGMANIPWLNPQKPSITPVLNSCGDYTFTPGFLTHFNDAIDYNNAVWNFGDGTGNFTNSGASATNSINHVYTTGATGNKTISLTLTDATCGHTWSNTYTLNVPCILPVELVDFSVIPQNGGVELNWSTATEINNKNFEIQRSYDGINFVTIGIKEGMGYKSSLTSYSFFDDEVSNTKVYYRLVQHDWDGKSENSRIVMVQLEKKDIVPMVVAPNPFTSSFTLTKLRDEKATIVVYDILGREVERLNTGALAGAYALGQNLNQGNYIIEYITDQNSYTLRVEKQ